MASARAQRRHATMLSGPTRYGIILLLLRAQADRAPAACVLRLCCARGDLTSDARPRGMPQVRSAQYVVPPPALPGLPSTEHPHFPSYGFKATPQIPEKSRRTNVCCSLCLFRMSLVRDRVACVCVTQSVSLTYVTHTNQWMGWSVCVCVCEPERFVCVSRLTHRL